MHQIFQLPTSLTFSHLLVFLLSSLNCILSHPPTSTSSIHSLLPPSITTPSSHSIPTAVSLTRSQFPAHPNPARACVPPTPTPQLSSITPIAQHPSPSSQRRSDTAHGQQRIMVSRSTVLRAGPRHPPAQCMFDCFRFCPPLLRADTECVSHT